MLSAEREVKKLRSNSTSSGLRGRMVIAAPSMRAASALQVSEIGGGVAVSVVTAPAYGNRPPDVVGRWSPRRWASASARAPPYGHASAAGRNAIPPRSLRPPEAPGRAHTIGAWSRRELGRVVTVRPSEPEAPRAHARSIPAPSPSGLGEKVTTLVGPGGRDGFGPAGPPWPGSRLEGV